MKPAPRLISTALSLRRSRCCAGPLSDRMRAGFHPGFPRRPHPHQRSGLHPLLGRAGPGRDPGPRRALRRRRLDARCRGGGGEGRADPGRGHGRRGGCLPGTRHGGAGPRRSRRGARAGGEPRPLRGVGRTGRRGGPGGGQHRGGDGSASHGPGREVPPRGTGSWEEDGTRGSGPTTFPPRIA